ncbi:hypothetical protein [Lacticaseibacillus paracasei]|uniref:hypothetical protein n=1 Tax=Lacticaseibacillus paracasei TaxID=1597 RepID=UPI00399657D2
MSNETKRDVFEELLESYMYSEDIVIDEISTDGVADRLNLGNNIASTRDRYAAALPDDLPVIPEVVSEWLTWCKMKHHSLKDALDGETRVSEDVFARAWLDGVWRVEETGEIVKLEAEK